MFRHESLEMVVNQSIWMEGDANFADVILPACTSFERWDIGEWRIPAATSTTIRTNSITAW